MNRRKNRMDLLFQITERLQELTGEQNVWKAIDKLQGGIKEERAENLKAITTIMKLVNRSNDRLRHKLKKHQEYERMHGVEEGVKQERDRTVGIIDSESYHAISARAFIMRVKDRIEALE